MRCRELADEGSEQRQRTFTAMMPGPVRPFMNDARDTSPVKTAAATLALATGLLTGCAPSSTPAQEQPRASSSSSVSSTMPDLSRFPVASPGTVEEHAGATIDARPVLSWNRASRATALKAATRVMRAFARPRVPEARWWADLAPLLSTQAQLDYAGTDPASVPASRLTGAARTAQVPIGRVVRVHVPTNAGTYTVTLSRRAAASAWLAERLDPPERPRR
jgi:hypothetical protein